MKRGFMAACSVLVLLTGCELRYQALEKLDIQGADGFFLEQTDANRHILHKLSRSGTSLEVKAMSAGGLIDSTEKFNPTAVYYGNDETVIIVFDEKYVALVSLKTGEVALIENMIVPCRQDHLIDNIPIVCSDDQGRLYYRGYVPDASIAGRNENLYRLSLSGNGKVTMTPFFDQNSVTIHSFLTDGAGNVLCKGGNEEGSFVRLFYADGGHDDLFINPDESLLFWIAADDSFYFWDTTQNSGILKLSIGENSYYTEFYADTSKQQPLRGSLLSIDGVSYLADLARNEIVEVYNSEKYLYSGTITQLIDKIVKVSISGESLLIAGYYQSQSRVVTVNLIDKTERCLYESEQWDICDITNSGGVPVVQAVSTEEDVSVIAQIDSFGSLKIMAKRKGEPFSFLTNIQ